MPKKPYKPSASPHNKAAKRYLKKLLRMVEEHPVREVDYDAEADMVEVWRHSFIEHRPSERQTHTIKIVMNVMEDD